VEECLRRFECFEPSEDCETEVAVEVVNAYGVEGIGEYIALMLVNRTRFVSAGIVVGKVQVNDVRFIKYSAPSLTLVIDIDI